MCCSKILRTEENFLLLQFSLLAIESLTLHGNMVSNKRKREVGKAKSKGANKGGVKNKFNNRKKSNANIVRAENKFNALPEEDYRSDDETNNNDIVLDDDYSGSDQSNEDGSDKNQRSDDDSEDDIFITSDNNEEPQEEEPESEDVDEEDAPLAKKRKTKDNELSGNNDFIGFGFESSEDEARDNYEDYSDDGVISNDEGGQVDSLTPTSLYPWIKAHDHSEQKEIADWLTMEMKDFVNYISPSRDEIVARNLVVKKLKQQIANCWPGAEAHVFGSCATDLYLPGSDIDMVVISPRGDCENRQKLYQLSSFLRQRKLAKDIEVIAGAKVPIIKFTDPMTNLNIDVSFERTNGLEAARRIRKWLASTAGLRELVLVVKQFLRSRKLNNVHVGGLGGYSTIILCYHFLKMHPRISTNNMTILDNLGSLLIEFFELYGRNFSYDDLIIAIDPATELPRYLKKSKFPDLITGRNPFSIVVQDPADPLNNITRSSYNLRDIKKAFGGAYQLLVDKCYRLHAASYKNRIGQLILGDIIKFRGKERDFNDDRNLVENHALINDNPGNSDISDNNDEYIEEGGNDDEGVAKFYSDVTVESDDEIQTKNTDKPTKDNRKVSDFISLDAGDQSESDSEEVEKDEKPANGSLDKTQRREYWKSKGVGL